MRHTELGKAQRVTMDTAKKFKPETILLWERVAEYPEAQRILGLFPSANIRLIKHQRSPLGSGVSQSQALLPKIRR